MERQRQFEHDRRRDSGETMPDAGSLDERRGEMNELMRAADRVFDAMNGLNAQQYLEQNMQTGGQ